MAVSQLFIPKLIGELSNTHTAHKTCLVCVCTDVCVSSCVYRCVCLFVCVQMCGSGMLGECVCVGLLCVLGRSISLMCLSD